MWEGREREEFINGIVSIVIFIALIGIWVYFNPTMYPEKQQVEHVRSQPHPETVKTYKYGYDPIHHKFRWHWE